MPVVCLLNQKGGVGKTSTCFHLSGTLAQLGRRVLLIDNDPQASLTQSFIGPQAKRALAADVTVAAILAGEEPLAMHVIRPGRPGVDLLPGSGFAAKYNVAEPHLVEASRQDCLRAFLEGVAASYDLVLIDCPPNLQLCSWAALVASDHLVIPLCPEDYASQGIHDVLEQVYRVQTGPNPGLNLAGYLLTRVLPRASLHKMFEQDLRGSYGDAVFATTVPHRIEYAEGVTERMPVATYKPKGAAAKEMKALVAELDQRMAARAKGAA